MRRACILALVLLGVGSPRAAQAEDLPPPGVELTPTGRVSIRRVAGFRLPSAKVRPIRYPGKHGLPTRLSVIELHALPLATAIEASLGPQQVKLTGTEWLPTGNYDIDVYVWQDEDNLLPLLARSLQETFRVDFEFTQETKTYFHMRLRTAEDQPPPGEAATQGTTLHWHGRPSSVALGLTRQLRMQVIDMTASTDKLKLSLVVGDNPSDAADIVRQAFDQGIVLEQHHEAFPVLKISRGGH